MTLLFAFIGLILGIVVCFYAMEYSFLSISIALVVGLVVGFLFGVIVLWSFLVISYEDDNYKGYTSYDNHRKKV